MITGLEHVAVSVSDMERSIAFYRDALGMEVIRILECSPESDLGKVVGMLGCEARIVHMQSGSNMVELFEYRQPRGRPVPADHRQADHGIVHMGFRSTDARADYARLKALGVRVFGEPVEFRPGVWLFYFYGPDGEVCELRES